MPGQTQPGTPPWSGSGWSRPVTRPRLYESSGNQRRGGISREGKPELREAIIELGRALRQGHPDFARYARELASRGKPPGVVACAVGNRTNRVAFAMMRDQRPFDPARWA